MDNEFKDMYRSLVKAKYPEDIFGTFKSKDSSDQILELKHKYRGLLMKVHPDHRKDATADEKYMAEEATRILLDYYKLAQERVNDNTYGKRVETTSKNKVEAEFSARGYDYKIFSGDIKRDFCNIYLGERKSGADLEKICLKIITDRRDNDLILNESQVLQNIMHKSLPVYLDNIILEDGRRANVLRQIEDSYDLYAVKDQFPRGLPQEHAVWVMDRLLSVLGYMHLNKTIHGAIEPGNIMITPKNHNGLLIDFLLSIPEANTDGAKYIGVNSYSAPEISRGARPHPSADMYSLGKSMIYLLGGYDENIPSGVEPDIKRFLEGFIEHDPRKRKSDAWASWHELKKTRTKVFGAPSQFLELIMR